MAGLDRQCLFLLRQQRGSPAATLQFFIPNHRTPSGLTPRAAGMGGSLGSPTFGAGRSSLSAADRPDSSTRTRGSTGFRGNSVAFSESLEQDLQHDDSFSTPHKAGYTEHQKQRLAETNTIFTTCSLNFFDLAGGDLFEASDRAQVSHLEECVRLLAEQQQEAAAAEKEKGDNSIRKEFSTSMVGMFVFLVSPAEVT